MEVVALCIRLLVTVVTLLCAHAQKEDAVLCIVPNRLQFFEYESVTFHCDEYDDSTGCKRVHEFKEEIPQCLTNRVKSAGSSCNIKNVYAEDSGEYWCEAGGGRSNNSINITVTGGSVILESPALPVMEGEAVTLRCRNKTTSSNLSADFYKDGLFVRNSSSREMTIYNVSKSHEGLYKCNISGAGESPESWLAVRALKSTVSPPESNNDAPSSSSNTAPWIIVTDSLVILLLMVGIHHFGKSYWHRVSIESSAADADKSTYGSAKKNRKKKDEDEFLSRTVYCSLDLDETQQLDMNEFLSRTVYCTLGLDETQQLGRHREHGHKLKKGL